jgi:hypothetical protein
MDNSIIKTQKFGGLDIAVSGFDDGETRVRDIDLGEWLELSRPRDIRKDIKRYLDSGKLNDYDVATVCRDIEVGTSGGCKQATEYWMTEPATMYVAARSDQPKGSDWLKRLIFVFYVYREESGKASRLIDLVFRDKPIPNHKKRLFCPLAIQLSKLIDNEWDGTGAPPIWIKSIAKNLYKWALPIDGEQSKRRELNVSPSRDNADYDWLTDEGEASLVDVLKAGEILASASQSYRQWKDLMENRYENKALQLELLVNVGRLTASTVQA